ncbi:KLTH0E16588p [Lachancea thermotolerans CBS 6340]|uniref:KLTH0E16588p n=1 Tax=Lachancea thermotolerans (strain ATCC 56472 / CBS 6340 / NRRL Y-8284) TaxID=559295 RepID=C5DJ04_LACTC|nr:KLTH0E16588p [Lachancea thermotolerans CBS 6340]CAR23765.1 KLTH0E16588p [Lachancea thermotolerans CBS 6340]
MNDEVGGADCAAVKDKNAYNATECDTDNEKELHNAAPWDERAISNNSDVDIAKKLALDAADVLLTPEEDKKLVRKIDLNMFPLMCLLYAVQYMDKASSSNAAIMGLRTDLKMKGNQYSWVGSSFYFGYLLGLFTLPPLLQKSNHFMKLLCLIIISWGLVLALHAAPTVNYASFIFLRCLLGFLESAITPAFTIITSQYWKTEEHFLRVCLWFGFNGLGGIWGSAMAYGLYDHKDSYSIPAWRLVFLVTGCITIFVGFLMIVHLPDSPEKAWFLSNHEKILLVKRIQGNQQGFGNHRIKKYQIAEAFKDVRTWLYFLYSVASQIPNGGLGNFQTILFHGEFKFSTKKTLLISLGTNAVEWVGCPLFGWLSYRCYKRNTNFLNSRLCWAFISITLVFTGVCMLAFADKSKNSKMAGLFLYQLAPVAFICILSSISSNTLGFTKKWTVSSINLVAYAAANIAGPHTFIDSQAPDYNGAKIAIVVCYAAALVIIATLYLVNLRENRKRDTYQDIGKKSGDKLDAGFNDLTDFENLEFRYAL